MKNIIRHAKKRRAQSSAWLKAQAYGVDTSLLEVNLHLSVDERLKKHDATLNTILALREALKNSQ